LFGGCFAVRRGHRQIDPAHKAILRDRRDGYHKGREAENYSRLNRIALNLLKQQTSHKVGIQTKRLRAGGVTII
jgi:hypothetical protein